MQRSRAVRRAMPKVMRRAVRRAMPKAWKVALRTLFRARALLMLAAQVPAETV